MDSLEGMDAGVPAQHLQQFVVEAEGEGETHGPQTDVGENSDGAELEQTGQADHQAREDHASPPHIPPVHQIHDCNEATHTLAAEKGRKDQQECKGDHREQGFIGAEGLLKESRESLSCHQKLVSSYNVQD